MFTQGPRRIFATGEGIAPDFIRDDLRLIAGYDELGFSLLSDSKEGDEFLSKLEEELA